MVDRLEDRKNPLLPSMANLLFMGLLLIVLGGHGGDLLADGDTGYHIRAGQYIASTLQVPVRDIFSHLTPPPQWTAHEWLSEVIFYAIDAVSGLTGLVAFMAIIFSAVYALLFKFLRVSGIGILVAVFMAALASAASSVHWLARPHAFSLIFIIVFYSILDDYRLRGNDRLLFLPPLMVLWANLHAGFIFGLIMMTVYLAVDIWDSVVSGADNAQSGPRVKRLALVTVLSVLAVLINPKGIFILIFPFKTIGNTYMINHVTEWFSPNFHNLPQLEYLMLLLIFVFGISRTKLGKVEIIMLLLVTHMALYSVRYVPIFAIIASPMIGRGLDSLVEQHKDVRVIGRFHGLSGRIAKTDSRSGGYLWPVASVAITAVLVFAGYLHYEFDKKVFPVDAVEFLKSQNLDGNMFNNDEFGDYIIYKAWPEYKVFFDGRSDMYGEEVMKDYFTITGIGKDWDKVISKYGIQWIVYNSDSALAGYLRVRDDWRLVYSDKVAEIFVREIQSGPDSSGDE